MGQGDYQELRDLSIAQDSIGQLLRSLHSLVATKSLNFLSCFDPSTKAIPEDRISNRLDCLMHQTSLRMILSYYYL
jgi:hypothetical protein